MHLPYVLFEHFLLFIRSLLFLCQSVMTLSVLSLGESKSGTALEFVMQVFIQSVVSREQVQYFLELVISCYVSPVFIRRDRVKKLGGQGRVKSLRQRGIFILNQRIDSFQNLLTFMT